MFLSSAFVVALAAISLPGSNAAPIDALARRDLPGWWDADSLEPYHQYRERYNALDCDSKQGTSFFDTCCKALSKDQSPDDLPDRCQAGSQDGGDDNDGDDGGDDSGDDGDDGEDDDDDSDDCGDDDDDEDDHHHDHDHSDDGSHHHHHNNNGSDGNGSPDNSGAPASTPAPDASTPAPSPDANSTPTSAPVAPSAPTPDVAPTAPSSTSTSKHEQHHGSAHSSSNTNGGVSSDDSTWNAGGFATFYHQEGTAGACGNYHGDNELVAAMDIERYGNADVASSICGKHVKVTNQKNHKSVVVLIADACPTCKNDNSIDLSVAAFTKIATKEEGMVPIDWEFLDY